ncbi:MAG TPA: 50S ribosomal protein L22 [Firmicutes bacterium]|jgi:large subunit ribosomal protein L22|nr:50S ribosomal protein L22 [Bacillota bacterium]HAW70379.1 50S ribosomal protein L22 [Bacillota bacterium]HAZ21067.1 50S ribosomal protein L22 [Bacillota bacterium]HBE05449.1 50S ribosomal protein L22 [Bacillota bacterium]HBG45114.1 50S ribosomal protein L22 [Bacillota bacterium]
MESKASARFVRIAPRKVRQVIDLIRGKSLAEAISTLDFAPKAAASVISKVVKSAAANAETNHQMNRDALYVAQAFVDQGPTLKRFMPRAQGRAAMIRKRTSHITVVLKQR